MKLKLFFGLCLLLAGFANAEEAEIFDDSVEIKPLTKELSATESSQENSTDLSDVDDGSPLSELLCADEKLKKQVENFIYSYINKESTGSVIEQRKRYLLARNLHDFIEVTNDKPSSKNNYLAASVISFLKINEVREIYKICRSSGNDNKKFADLYAVIYRDGGYYKIVVPNGINSTKNIDKATFVYNW